MGVMKKKKICFVASSGGHLEEIYQLKQISEKYKSFLVTEKTDFIGNIFCDKKYFVKQINRKQKWFIIDFIKLFVRALYIIQKERPTIIISTGALCSYPFCLLGKMLGAKVIYIESFARVVDASLTGKLVYKIADLFIVQWEEMKNIYPKAVVGGGIF